MLNKKSFYIDGKWVSPIEQRSYKVIDPSNEEPCAEISLGGKKDINKAVTAAKKAFVLGLSQKKKRDWNYQKNYMLFIKKDGLKWQNSSLLKWELQ